MKKTISLLISIIFPIIIYSQNLPNQTLDDKINESFSSVTQWFVDGIFAEIPITKEVGIPWVLIVLILGATYFTFYFKLINIRGFLLSINIVNLSSINKKRVD